MLRKPHHKPALTHGYKPKYKVGDWVMIKHAMYTFGDKVVGHFGRITSMSYDVYQLDLSHLITKSYSSRKGIWSFSTDELGRKATKEEIMLETL